MIHRLFPASLLACISEGREPRKTEVEDLAAKIWQEAFRTDKTHRWQALPDHCQVRRRAVAAAEVAFGQASRDPMTLRHPASPVSKSEEENPLFPWPALPLDRRSGSGNADSTRGCHTVLLKG